MSRDTLVGESFQYNGPEGHPWNGKVVRLEEVKEAKEWLIDANANVYDWPLVWSEDDFRKEMAAGLWIPVENENVTAE